MLSAKNIYFGKAVESISQKICSVEALVLSDTVKANFWLVRALELL